MGKLPLWSLPRLLFLGLRGLSTGYPRGEFTSPKLEFGGTTDGESKLGDHAVTGKNTITDINGVMEAAEFLEQRSKSLVWWRGHGKDKWVDKKGVARDWKLVPGVYRSNNNDPYRYETNLVVSFKARAPSRQGNLPNSDRPDEWLVLMQHHGLPTRLLDWSASILTALYFAVRDHQQQNGALWAINPARFNHIQVGTGQLLTPNHKDAWPLFLPPFIAEATQHDRILAFLPTELDTRMLLQQTGFTVHGYSDPIETLAQHEEFLMKWTIPSDAKKDLQSSLERLGIRESTLFPDLDHLANDIKSMTFTPFKSDE